MSFEGYYELLCANGHRGGTGCWDEVELNGKDRCAACGEPWVFEHLVDTTNDEGDPYPFVEVAPARTRLCDLGHYHIIEPARYAIPDSKEALR